MIDFDRNRSQRKAQNKGIGENSGIAEKDLLNFSESGWWGRILSGNERIDSNS
jgi:hypothetical protein